MRLDDGKPRDLEYLVQALLQPGQYLSFALIDLLLPTQNLNLSPGVGFPATTNGAEPNAQFGFSTIAEGVMNCPITDSLLLL